jgi:hypothetical protein
MDTPSVSVYEWLNNYAKPVPLGTFSIFIYDNFIEFFCLLVILVDQASSHMVWEVITKVCSELGTERRD